MNNSYKILLSFLGIVSLCSAPLHANERAVILSLTDGRRVCTKMSAVTAKGATFEENGSTQFASRAEIRMYTFPTVATAVLPRAEVKRAPETQGKPEAKGELSSLLNSPVSDHDLPQLLQRPEVRAMFESLQGRQCGSKSELGYPIVKR